ncbi:MAG: hypothetical protein PHE83_09735 [Opitutaceae bacterium]|nr:hypothetical protein [Opitutaceae bacterium]
MSDRLQELLHQKALLTEQAAWLEREIVLERARTGMTAPVAAPPPAIPPPPASPSIEADAEAMLDQYRTSPQSIQQEVRRGCFLYFLGALALVGLSMLAIHFFHHRPN